MAKEVDVCPPNPYPALPNVTWKKNVSPLACAVASGLLLAACFWPLDLHFLAWVALVPMIVALPRLSPRIAWVLGGLMGLIFYGIGLRWLPWIYGPSGVVVIVGLSILMGYSFHIALKLNRRWGPASTLWVIPICFTAQEWLRSEGLPLQRFSQLGLGYSQIHNLWIAQIASLGGVYSITFLLSAASAALAYALMRRTVRAMSPLAAVIMVTLALGAISQPGDYDSARRITVAAVQDESYDYGKLLRLAQEAASEGTNGATFVVFPEHTLARTVVTDVDRLPLIAELKALSVATGSYFSIGAHTLPHGNDIAASPGRYNTAQMNEDARPVLTTSACPFDNVNILLGPKGIVGQQPKSVPMPFWTDGNPALTQETFVTPPGQVGLYVCYDESFTDVIRHLTDKGAGLLLGNIYNGLDWPVQQRMQQSEMMAFRAIEQRRCMVRSASSGVSQIIDATGRVRAQREMSDGSGVLRGVVYFNYERTFFARVGYLFVLIVTGAFLIAAAGLNLRPWLSSAWKAFVARRAETCRSQ